jgi:hypothetical protein
VIFLILAWSVLFAQDAGDIRFGIYICFLSQVVALVSSFLYNQNEKQKKARRFMQHPETPKPDKPDTTSPSNAPNLFHK